MMSPDILAIAIAIAIQLFELIILGWYLSRRLRQIIAEVTFNMLQGRRIEDALRESLCEPRKSPA